MDTRRIGSAFILALLAITTASCETKTSHLPIKVSLGTGPSGGNAIAATFKEFDPGLKIEPHQTKGDTESIDLLEEGKLDLALVGGEAAYEALSGIGRPPARIKFVWAMYPSLGMFVVNAKSPYLTMSDLKGQAVAFGPRGSALALRARYVVDGIGLDCDRDFKAVYNDLSEDGPRVLDDGRVAALWISGVGHLGEGSSMMPEARLHRVIVPRPDEHQRILAKHKFLRQCTLSAGSYPGLTGEKRPACSWSSVFASSTLSDDVAYRIAVILDGSRPWGDGDSASRSTIAATWDPAQIHPGVMRFLREAKLVKTP